MLFPLHEKDPGNPVLVENLRTIGTARFKQVRGEAQTRQTRDLKSLESLSAELTHQAAHVDVPDDLRAAWIARSAYCGWIRPRRAFGHC